MIRDRYYDVRVRPQVIVENYPSQYGYVWVSGSWGWNGGEWIWTGGHYDADPGYKVYYDDDSYDVDEDFGADMEAIIASQQQPWTPPSWE